MGAPGVRPKDLKLGGNAMLWQGVSVTVDTLLTVSGDIFLWVVTEAVERVCDCIDRQPRRQAIQMFT